MRLAVLMISASLVSAASEIPQGSHVLLRLENSVSTRTAREGDYVYLRTAVPIAANGQIAVPEGSYVQGVVTHSLRSGRVKGKATVEKGRRHPTADISRRPHLQQGPANIHLHQPTTFPSETIRAACHPLLPMSRMESSKRRMSKPDPNREVRRRTRRRSMQADAR